MTASCTRLIALAGATVADPLAADDPQLLLVQGRVGVNIEPTITQNGPAPLATTPDFWDVLVNPHFDKSPYVVLYEAELYADNSIIVKRDLFGPGDFSHTWAGWPIPGDEEKPPEIDPEMPQMTEAQQKALAHIYAKRNGAGKKAPPDLKAKRK